MEKLKITENGLIKKISFTEKFATGIFLVTDNKLVKQNCKILTIDLGENTNPLELRQKVTKIEKTGILTIRIMDQYFQYIFKDYAAKSDVDRLIQDVAPQSREALKAAYELAGLNNLDQTGNISDFTYNMN